MRALSLIILAIVLHGNTAFGQKFLKKLQDKAETKISEKLEEKIDEKLDEKIDEELEKTFESSEESDDENESLNTDKSQSGFFSKVSSDKTYTFTQSITYIVGNGKEKDNTEMTFFSNKDNGYFAVEILSDQDTKIIQISDSTESISLIETAGMKMQSGTSMTTEKILEKSKQQQLNDETEITKTGNTKDILGYTCYEYTVENEEGTGTVWVTNDASFEETLFYQNNSELQGLMLESTFNNGKKVISTLKATSINTNANISIDASEYKSFGR